MNKIPEELANNFQRLSTSESLGARLRHAIFCGMAEGSADLRRTAEILNLSRRTLQRRLFEQGTTFGAELDSMRRELAVRLIRDRNLAIHDVSSMLGYSDTSAFSRAFRRWTSESPREYRARVRREPMVNRMEDDTRPVQQAAVMSAGERFSGRM